MLSKRCPSHLSSFCECVSEIERESSAGRRTNGLSISPQQPQTVPTRIQNLDHPTMGGGTPPTSLSDSILSTISVSLILLL